MLWHGDVIRIVVGNLNGLIFRSLYLLFLQVPVYSNGVL